MNERERLLKLLRQQKLKKLLNEQKNLVDKTDQEKVISEVIYSKKDDLKGDKGDSPTKESLIEIIKTLIPAPIKGDNGYTPKKGIDFLDGKNYVLTKKDKVDIARSINVPIVDRIIEKRIETVREIPIVKEIAKQDTADSIRNKLEILPSGEKLSLDSIEGLKTFNDTMVLKVNRIIESLDNHRVLGIKKDGVRIGQANELNFKTGSNATLVVSRNSEQGVDITINSTASGGVGTVTSVDASGGTTGLTFTGGPITAAGTLILSGTLAPANGGTGTSTVFTQGSVIFAGASGIQTQDNPNFFFDATNHNLRIGPTSAAISTENRLSIIGNANDYHGTFTQNQNAGLVASTDTVIGNDLTTADPTTFVDFGLNSSVNTNPSYTAFGASDAYLFTSGQVNNLVLAAGTVGKRIDFVAGGTLSTNRVASVTSTGLGIGTISPSVQLDIRKDAIGQTPTTSTLLENQVVATSTVLQYSPALQFTGSLWYSTGGAQTGVAMSRMYLKPFNAANPQGATIIAGNMTGQGNPFPGNYSEDYWFYHGQSNGSSPTGGTFGGLRVPTGIQFNNGATAGIYASLGMGASSAAGGYGTFVGTSTTFSGTGNTNTVQLGMSSSFNYTVTGGIQNVVAIGGNLVTATASGATWSALNWGGTINQASSSTGVTRGIYLNPSVIAGIDNRGFDYAPNVTTTGTGINVGYSYTAIINQGVSATGITRGMYINPTLTNAVDFRAIEVAQGNTLLRNLKLTTAGDGLYVKEGTNATMGTGTLSGGTLAVSTTKVTANSRIFITDTGGTITNLGTLYISAKTAGTGFTVSSTNILDASTFNWIIIEPA